MTRYPCNWYHTSFRETGREMIFIDIHPRISKSHRLTQTSPDWDLTFIASEVCLIFSPSSESIGLVFLSLLLNNLARLPCQSIKKINPTQSWFHCHIVEKRSTLRQCAFSRDGWRKNRCVWEQEWMVLLLNFSVKRPEIVNDKTIIVVSKNIIREPNSETVIIAQHTTWRITEIIWRRYHFHCPRHL